MGPQEGHLRVWVADRLVRWQQPSLFLNQTRPPRRRYRLLSAQTGAATSDWTRSAHGRCGTGQGFQRSVFDSCFLLTKFLGALRSRQSGDTLAFAADPINVLEVTFICYVPVCPGCSKN